MALPKRQNFRVERIEPLLRNRLVDLPPVHGSLGHVVTNDKLVFGRPAGERLGPDHKRSAGRQKTFVAADSVLDKLRSAEVPMGYGDIANAVLVETITAR